MYYLIYLFHFFVFFWKTKGNPGFLSEHASVRRAVSAYLWRMGVTVLISLERVSVLYAHEPCVLASETSV